jgi:hypothetical protein
MEAASFCRVTNPRSNVKRVCLTIHPAERGATTVWDVF